MSINWSENLFLIIFYENKTYFWNTYQSIIIRQAFKFTTMKQFTQIGKLYLRGIYCTNRNLRITRNSS